MKLTWLGTSAAVCMSNMNQNFCLFQIRNEYFLKFRVYLLMYPPSLSSAAARGGGTAQRVGPSGRAWPRACPPVPVGCRRSIYQSCRPAPGGSTNCWPARPAPALMFKLSRAAVCQRWGRSATAHSAAAAASLPVDRRPPPPLYLLACPTISARPLLLPLQTPTPPRQLVCPPAATAFP